MFKGYKLSTTGSSPPAWSVPCIFPPPWHAAVNEQSELPQSSAEGLSAVCKDVCLFPGLLKHRSWTNCHILFALSDKVYPQVKILKASLMPEKKNQHSTPNSELILPQLKVLAKKDAATYLLLPKSIDRSIYLNRNKGENSTRDLWQTKQSFPFRQNSKFSFCFQVRLFMQLLCNELIGSVHIFYLLFFGGKLQLDCRSIEDTKTEERSSKNRAD